MISKSSLKKLIELEGPNVLCYGRPIIFWLLLYPKKMKYVIKNGALLNEYIHVKSGTWMTLLRFCEYRLIYESSRKKRKKLAQSRDILLSFGAVALKYLEYVVIDVYD